jgi:predicted small lipoprotein YifL
MKRTLNALVAVALTGALTACGDNDKPDPIPDSESSTTSTSSPTEPTETATTPPPWEDDYTPKQLQAYEAALQRWDSYEQRSEPIWAAGKATPVAEALFKEYFPSPQWQFYNERLADYEQVKVLVKGLATVYWSRPKLITKNALTVEIEQCVDYSSIKVTQYGKEVGSTTAKPRLRTIQLAMPKGYDWLIYKLVDATSERRPRTCNR